MTPKLLETIFAIKFSSNWNYRIYRQQRNGHLEALKWLKITYRKVGLHKNTNWSSEFHSTKAKLHSLCRLDSSSSFCNSFSSSLEDWDFASWLGLSAILWLQISRRSQFAVEMKASQLSLNFAASRRENRANSWMISSSDWLASLLSSFWLIDGSGLKYILAIWILHFSPKNIPQCPMKLL